MTLLSICLWHSSYQWLRKIDGQVAHTQRSPEVMIKVLKDLLERTSREHSAKKAAPAPILMRPGAGGDFRAVSIAPSILCCAAATRAMDRCFLLREAPHLPLAACTMPKNCKCKFRKNADRRNSERRLFGAGETNRWFAGLESRRRGGRRSTEK